MEARLFPEGTEPEYTQAEWYEGREAAPHVDEVIHRGRLDIAAAMVNAAYLRPDGPADVVDLSCGDGGLLTLLHPDIPAWGYDLAPANVNVGLMERKVDVRFGDVVKDLDDLQLGELAVMTEMLEHLVDPHGFLRRVAQHCEFVVCSSPYTETAESHYGFHTWAWDVDGYQALIEQAGFKVAHVELWSMFQIHFAERA